MQREPQDPQYFIDGIKHRVHGIKRDLHAQAEVLDLAVPEGLETQLGVLLEMVKEWGLHVRLVWLSRTPQGKANKEGTNG